MTKPFSCNLMPLTIFFQLHHHDIYCLERAFRVRLRAKFARRPRFRRSLWREFKEKRNAKKLIDYDELIILFL